MILSIPRLTVLVGRAERAILITNRRGAANRLAQRYMHIARVYHAACQTIHRHFSEQG